ncbi:hypothetical protein BJX62DRAFT_216771, partial [Aspergillus germanicus]
MLDGIAKPAHIGVFGMSSRGLLAAVMGAQRPDLHSAIASDSLLTDMLRSPKMGVGSNEYSDPVSRASYSSSSLLALSQHRGRRSVSCSPGYFLYYRRSSWCQPRPKAGGIV